MNEQQCIDTVKAIIEGIGGKDNLQSATYCTTRLRLVLKDESNINQQLIDKIELVKGCFLINDRLQLIIGTGTVDKVHRELMRLTAVQVVSESEVNANINTHANINANTNGCTNANFNENTRDYKVVAESGNLLLRPLKTISDIFEPIMPAIVACGLLKALSNLITAKGLFYANTSLIELFPQYSDIASILISFASAPFVFLPVLIAFSATRVFGGTAFLGAALGAFMIHPELMSFYSYAYGTADTTYWNVFGLAIEKVGFQGTVLPVLVMSWVLATFEKAFRKVVPASLDSLITPLFALLITAFITFALTGPLLREAGTLLANYLQLLYETRGLEGAGLVGFLYAPIMITGMHQLFPVLELKLITDIAKTGGSFILPVAAMSSMAQGGATWAAFFATKNKKLKGFALGGGTSAVFGVTEPAIFGVNLKLRYPFYAAICAAAAGAAYMSFTGTLATSLGVVVGIPSIATVDANHWMPYIYGMCIAFFGAFFATLLLSVTPLNSERHNRKKKAKEEAVIASVPTITPTSANAEISHDRIGLTKTESKTDNQPVTKAETKAIIVETEATEISASVADRVVDMEKVTESSESVKEPVLEYVQESTKAVINGDWVMPIKGEVIALKDIPDPVFSSGAMGAGFGIKPTMNTTDDKLADKTFGRVISPISGIVSAIFPSKHAICIDGADGLEVLIHIGIDTVALEGKGFTLLIEEGVKVEAGTPLLEVDWEGIKDTVPSIITPILFTSIDSSQQIEMRDGKPVFGLV